jgi:hypothetical protein
VVLIARIGGPVDERAADFDRRTLIDQSVLDRLKRANRPVERDANLRVLGCCVIGGCRDADQFGDESDAQAQ